ncbi:MAG: NAD-dependent epimerase/dehydratase family protein, partial [Bacteroidota bacterium]
MRNVLVTGGRGFLGSNLALALLDEGCNVRILRRANSDLRAIGSADVGHCIGDLLDPPSLRKAIKGCDTVFHTAAKISYWRKERHEMMKTNVTGTRNMVHACLELGVETFIHTSSVAAIGFKTDGPLRRSGSEASNPADEQNEFNWDKYDVGYRIAKYRAELEVLRGVSLGLPAVMVNPSVIIGPRDIYFRGGRIVHDVARKRIFYYTDGGINVVFVDDVVRGHLQAARVGRIGERYILC